MARKDGVIRCRPGPATLLRAMLIAHRHHANMHSFSAVMFPIFWRQLQSTSVSVRARVCTHVRAARAAFARDRADDCMGVTRRQDYYYYRVRADTCRLVETLQANQRRRAKRCCALGRLKGSGLVQLLGFGVCKRALCHPRLLDRQPDDACRRCRADLPSTSGRVQPRHAFHAAHLHCTPCADAARVRRLTYENCGACNKMKQQINTRYTAEQRQAHQHDPHGPRSCS